MLPLLGIPEYFPANLSDENWCHQRIVVGLVSKGGEEALLLTAVCVCCSVQSGAGRSF